jgi:hypothetical protein
VVVSVASDEANTVIATSAPVRLPCLDELRQTPTPVPFRPLSRWGGYTLYSQADQPRFSFAHRGRGGHADPRRTRLGSQHL